MRVETIRGHGRAILRHSGAMRSIEPGISRFRVWSFGPSRNDEISDRRVRPDRALVSYPRLNHNASNRAGPGASHNSGALALSKSFAFDVTPIPSSGQNVIQNSWNFPHRG